MRILFLSTWFPYPLNQGSKIRAYHLLKALAERHNVVLVSFEDAPVETAWVDHMLQYCQRVEIVHQNPFAHNPIRSVLGLLSLKPSSVVKMYSREMSDKVQRIASEWSPERVVALTYVTAPYALQIPISSKIVDVDYVMTHMLYESYQQANGLLNRSRRWLAWWKFRRYERQLLNRFDLSLLVSERDRQILCDFIPKQSNRLIVVPNGVDTTLNNASSTPEPNTMIFNGALTYFPNFDAMEYFLRDIFPLIKVQIPDVLLRITGKTEEVPISQLALNSRVIFTGYLEDIWSMVANSWACVVPLRLGGGTRLKILEAMALGTPVISTSKGAEGLDVISGKHILIADTPSEFSAQAIRLLKEPELRDRLVVNARQLVEKRYDWIKIGQEFCTHVENVPA